MKKLLTTAAALVIGASAMAQAQESDLQSLLNKVRNGRVTETAEHQKREAEFQQRRDQQEKLLADAKAETKRLERESARLEEQRRVNEVEITRQVEIRRDRLGQLSELFGVLQQAAGDARSVIKTSHASINVTDRLGGINTLVEKASSSSELPSIDDIRVWPTQMMIEMIESRRVVTTSQTVRRVDGTEDVVDVTRLGDFGLVGDGGFFVLKDNNVIDELTRQPPGRFTDTIGDFQNAGSDIAAVGIDPSRGQILSLQVQKATIQERIDQGGPIGYLILGLGAAGVLMAVLQWFYLTVVAGKVRAQIRSGTPNTNNPLGRVLAVYDDNRNVDVETLELKLDEAILKETPALERFLTIIKLISAVAPLFGLLGTVTGMIETFQAITLFGAGDPTTMAAGISTALMTTVEGLVVAIPTLLLHSFVAGTSKSVIHVLEEQSAGIIAVHAEKENANASAG